jgi:hypothetical protein
MFILGEILPDKPGQNKKNPANQAKPFSHIQKIGRYISTKFTKANIPSAN